MQAAVTKQKLLIGHMLADPKAELGEPVYVDTDMLLDGGLLIAASSGRGKSHTFRKLIEETNGTCQQIIIDVEGEFGTLRELKGSSYLIAGVGEDADLQISINVAEQLALRVLETNIDIILDISEFDTDVEQHRFVGRFLKALIHIPKELWGRKTVVFVDEAHELAPQTMRKGQETLASDAMVMLAKKARKRGIRGIFATQRIADLRKSVISECDNKMIGGLNHYDDRKTVAQDIGLDKEIVDGLRKLTKGKFYAVGSAFGFEDAQLMRISDKLHTTHIKSGQRVAAYIPPAEGSKVAKILQTEFKDIETQADVRARNMQEAERVIADLKLKVKRLEGKAPKEVYVTPNTTTEDFEKVRKQGIKEGIEFAAKANEPAIEAMGNRLAKAEEFAHHVGVVASRTYGPLHDSIEKFMERPPQKILEDLRKVAADFQDLGHKGVEMWHMLEGARKGPSTVITKFKPEMLPTSVETMSVGPAEPAKITAVEGLNPTETAILKFLAQQHGKTYNKAQIGVNTGFSAKSSGMTRALKRLVDSGYITKPADDQYTIQDGPQLANAKSVLGELFEDRTKVSLQDWADKKLTGASQKIFKTMLEYGPYAAWPPAEVAKHAGIGEKSSNISRGLKVLVDLGLVQRTEQGYMVNTVTA
jgi:hypothetical protein